MRNLKRALSLALAAIMVMGMMVVGASAKDFTDKDEIQNKEAVSVLTTLNVLAGKEDGSHFDPNGIVTRAEMAKIICIMLNGGKEPVLGVKDKATFADIKGTWAEAYIEYCVSMGVISGRGDGRFDPTATVTGTEAAKMMLTALGYDAKVFKFTGADWAINVNVKANEPGVELYTRLEALDPTLGLTRDNAAQMAYNTLNAKVLVVTPSKVLATGEVTYQYTQDATFLSKKFGITKYVGVLAANDTYGLNNTTSGKGYSDVIVRTVDGANITPLFSNPYTVRAVADNALLGQEVVVFEKKNITGEKVVVGDIFATERNKVVTTYDELDKGLDSTKSDTVARFVKTNGLKLVTGATGTQYLVNNGAFTDSKEATLTNLRGQELMLIDNNADGVVDYVLQTDYTLAKIASKDETAKLVTLSNGKLVNDTDAVGYDDVKKGDIVLYSVKNGVYGMEVAATTEGMVSSYSAYAAGKTDGSITLDGEKYSPSQMTNSITSLITVLTNINGTAIKLGGTYRFYADKAGNFLAAEEISSVSNYALVLDSGARATSNLFSDNSYAGTVKLLLSDGTIGVYEVDMLASVSSYYNKATEVGATTIGGIAISNGDKDSARIYNMAKLLANTNNSDITVLDRLNRLRGTLVSVNINDGSVVLSPVVSGASNAISASKLAGLNGYAKTNTAIDKGVTYWTSNGKGYVMNSSTKFFCSTGADNGTVITGVQSIPGFKAEDVRAFDYDINTNVVKAVYVNYKASSAKVNFYRTSGPAVTIENGVTVYQYRGVLSDGTMTVLNSKSNAGSANVYTYTKDTNGFATLNTVPLLSGTKVTSGTYFSGTVTAINTEAVTMIDKNGTIITVAIDNTGLNTWNVIDSINGDTAPAIDLNENTQATLVFTSKNGMVVADAAFVTSLATTYTVTDGVGVSPTVSNYLPGQIVTVSGVTFTMPAYPVTVVKTEADAITALAAGDNVILGTGTPSGTITLGTGLVVNSNLIVMNNLADASGEILEVQSGNVVISGNANLSNTSLVAAGASLSIMGNLTANSGYAGTVSAKNATFTGAITNPGKLTVNGDVTISTASSFGELTADTLNVGTVIATVGDATIGTLNCGAAGGLTVTADKSATVTGNVTAAGSDLNAAADASLTVKGNVVGNVNLKGVGEITLASVMGDLTANSGTADEGLYVAGDVFGDVTMTQGEKLTVKNVSGAIAVADGILVLNGVASTALTASTTSDLVLGANGQVTLSFSSAGNVANLTATAPGATVIATDAKVQSDGNFKDNTGAVIAAGTTLTAGTTTYVYDGAFFVAQ